MSLPPWREALEAELRRRALPEAYRARLLCELSDHYLELEARQMSMDALSTSSLETQLGDPRTIASQAARAYRKNFVQRRPLICFVLGPLVGFPIAVAVVLFALILAIEGASGLFSAQQQAFFESPGVVNILIHSLAWCVRIVPFAAAAFFFVYLARRGRQDYRWSIVAVLLIGLLAASFQATVVDKVAGSQGQFSMGLSFPIGSPLAYLQIVAPLGAAVYAYLRRNDGNAVVAG